MSGYADWNAIVVYNAGDIVNYDSRIWVSLQNVNLNHVPSGGAPWWSQAGGSGGSFVNTLNTLTGNLNLVSTNLILDITPNNPNIEFTINPLATVDSLNTQTGAVSLTSSSLTITNPVPSQINLEAPVAVDSLNSQTGAVSLTSSGSTVAITNPAPGVINLEQAGGGGTLTGITAGTGIAVSGTAPSPTVSNTGTLAVYGGIGITIAGPSTGPTVNATGVLDVYSGKGVVANYINAPNTQTVSLNYRPDQAVVDNPNFILMDSANNGFVDGRNAPLNATLLQYPGTYYIRETDYTNPPDLQAWVLVQTGTAPGPGAVVSPSGAIYTVFNANPVGSNNITNLNFSYLRDNNFSPGLTSPLAAPQQISPNQSVSFMVNYLPTQGAGGTSADFTRPVITWIQKNSISGVPL
jgi:hypothetical protein